VNIDLIAPKTFPTQALAKAYLHLLKKTLSVVKFPHQAEVDVRITNNQTIKKINHTFRQKSYATDVLSFPFWDGQSLSKGHPIHLGQIIISYQKANQQAKAYGHSQTREYHFLFVHGLLHLLGYNHDTNANETTMLALQNQILGKRIKNG